MPAYGQSFLTPKPPSAPPEKPRYIPAGRIVSQCHAFLLETTGDYPALKTLAALCDLPPSTAYHHCRSLGLPLSQSRPRKVKTGP